MDHFLIRLRSFKLHLTIPKNQHSRLPKTLTLIYLPRFNETPLEINGAKIPPNKSAPIILRKVRSPGVADVSEVVFASTDRVYAGDGVGFEINLGGDKAFKGFFRRGVRWELKCEVIGFKIWAEVSVMMDGGILMREKVRLRRKRFQPELPTIMEEDEEEDKEGDERREDVDEEMGASDVLDYKEENDKDDGDGAMKKGISWVMNAGIFVACLGVGLFVCRAPLRRLMDLNLF